MRWRVRTWVALGVAGFACGWLAVAIVVRRPLSLGEALAGLALLPASISAWVDLHTLRSDTATARSPANRADGHEAATAKLGLLGGLDRLGDDPAIAVQKLRVHRSIPLGDQAPAHLDPSLPAWVERGAAAHVRRWMATARRRGGLLVIVGESSVGKTRLLYETAATELAGWPLLAPGLGETEVVSAFAERIDELDRPVVVWLDEIHRFLPGPWLISGGTPLSAGVIGRLLDATEPVVILGSMWPHHLSTLTASAPGLSGVSEPVHPNACDVLRHAEVVALDAFSRAETDAARTLSAHDPRLAVAAEDPQFGVTQALAGVPALMQRYQTATEHEKALLHAAIDAQRLGVAPPLSIDILTDAASGYLTGIRPTDDWVQVTLEGLSRRDGPHDRSAAPLLALPDSARHDIIGYEVADYLLQHTTRTRRSASIPHLAWQALITHTHQPEVLRRLGEAAANRGLDRHAVTLYDKAIDAGDPSAARELAEMLAEQGDVDGLWARADAGNAPAERLLANLLAERGDVDRLRKRADAGGFVAAARLTNLLAERGDVDGLRERAESGDLSAQLAALTLPVVLAEQGDPSVLRARAEAGDPWAAEQLAEIGAPADAADRRPSRSAVEMLVERGDVEELRARADAGEYMADYWLATMLVERGDVEELRARADAGDKSASARLAEMLVELGDVAELRARAEVGDHWAELRLAAMFAEQGDLDLLRTLVDARDPWATQRLVALLTERGDRRSLQEEVEAGTPGALTALRALEAHCE